MTNSRFNSQQLQAITHPSGPLLVIAGAGTGKTTVIVERIKWLISKELAKPEEILGLTFTEKAATEMEERLDQVMPFGYTQMWINTFHSFCETILRNEALEIGLNSQFRLLSETTSVSLIKQHLFDFNLDYYRPLGNPHKFISSAIQHFSRLHDEDVSPQEYMAWAKSQKEEKYIELSEFYQRYEELKIKEGVMDFSDLITNTLKLFRTRPRITAKYQHKFKYLLVDEFQDTNYSQNILIDLLINEKQNITIVADDDQAIYQWRGAAVGNVTTFIKKYPRSKLIVLTKNYRSSQLILDGAYNLITNNNPDRLEFQKKINKKLIAQSNASKHEIELLHSITGEDEASIVAGKIKEILAQNQNDFTPKDIAILVRTNSQAEIFVNALNKTGVPNQFLGPAKLFFQPEIKDLIAFFKIIDNPDDSISMYRLFIMPCWQINHESITRLINGSRKLNISLLDAAKLSNQSQIKAVTNLIENISSQSHTISPGQALYQFTEKSGLLKMILEYTPPITEVQAKNIVKFFNKVRSFEAENIDARINGVLDWIELATELGESPQATVDTDWSTNDMVNILTIHSSKGLEFKVVFIVNLTSDRFPSRNRKDPIEIPDELIKEISPLGDAHIQEERRLFYVGMTRAKEKLFFAGAKFYDDAKREKKLSPFVYESLGKSQTNTQYYNPGDLNYFKPPDKTTISSSLAIDYLTYSHIQTFEICPLHYKAKFILGLTTPPSASSSFGNSIHLVMRDLYLYPDENPSFLIEKNWIREGYKNKKHEQLARNKAAKFISEYLVQEPDRIHTPALLESNFRFKLGNLTIGGKFDRVNQLSDGKIEIVDYKTTENIPKGDPAKNIQLCIYALAAVNIKEGIFNKNPEDIKLSLYFFQNQSKMSFTPTQGDLYRVTEEILGYKAAIETSEFKCSGSILCRNCDFKSLCDN